MFVLLTVAAFVVRGFGQRGVAMGMLAFISFYVGQILHVSWAALPLDYAVIAYATLLVRLVLLRDRPERALARAVRSVRRQTAHLLETVRLYAAAPPSQTPQRALLAATKPSWRPLRIDAGAQSANRRTAQANRSPPSLSGRTPLSANPRRWASPLLPPWRSAI
jgi:hypothetical protein